MTVKYELAIKVNIPTKTEFRNYLKSLKEDDVTKFCKGANCPIAQYIVDYSILPKGSTVSVSGADDITIHLPGSEDLSFYGDAWIDAFITAVDEIQEDKNAGLAWDHKDKNTWHRVTSEEALKALGK